MPYSKDKLNQTLISLKQNYEKELLESKKTESTRRSSKFINILHEFLKYELRNHNINPSNIFPPLDATSPEKKILGGLKTKQQDITVFPLIKKNKEEILIGAHKIIDTYGSEFLAKTLTINIRGQFSSIKKNFDTIFERTFAEALNLHLRIPSMVLGELFLLPTRGYNTEKAKEGKIICDEENYLLKYINGFSAINTRKSISSNHYKYEKVCLIIVDFKKNPPKLINEFDDLQNYLVEKEIDDLKNYDIEKLKENFQNLMINDFIDIILDIYDNRHDINNILKN